MKTKKHKESIASNTSALVAATDVPLSHSLVGNEFESLNFFMLLNK
jgi:hypothetical protein